MKNNQKLTVVLDEKISPQLLKSQLVALGYCVDEDDGTFRVSRASSDALKAGLFDTWLQLVADAAPVSMAISRRDDGLLVFANEALIEFSGRQRHELLGKVAPQFYKNSSDRARLLEALERDGFVRSMELEFVRGDGEIRTMSTSVFPIELDGETLMVGAGTDVTDARKNQKALDEATSRHSVLLQELNHRVGNNLSALLALLRRERSSLAVNGGAEETDAWIGLERRIRALAAVHTLLSESMWRPIHARMLCHKTVESICFEHSPAPRVVVEGSNVEIESSQAQHLSLVLSELSLNAIEHATTSEQLVITVQTSRTNSEVVVIYQDNGPGYPDEILNRSQHHTHGLRLISDIATQYLGGEVFLESRSGAVATIRFPCCSRSAYQE